MPQPVPQPDAPQLVVKDLTLSFGGLNALSKVSLTVLPGTITSIIGPNGAGKNEPLKLRVGFLHCDRRVYRL